MTSAFTEQYERLFGRPWPVWGAAVLIAAANVFLFVFDRPLTASDGVRNWGDWALSGLGVLPRPDLAPWHHSGSMGLQQRLGPAVFLPDGLGWAGAVVLVFAVVLVVAVMMTWAALATWNESSNRFSALG